MALRWADLQLSFHLLFCCYSVPTMLGHVNNTLLGEIERKDRWFMYKNCKPCHTYARKEKYKYVAKQMAQRNLVSLQDHIKECLQHIKAIKNELKDLIAASSSTVHFHISTYSGKKMFSWYKVWTDGQNRTHITHIEPL